MSFGPSKEPSGNPASAMDDLGSRTSIHRSLRKEGGLSRSQLLRGFSEIIVLWTLPGLGERLFRRELYLVVNSISACCFQAVCSQVSLQWPPYRNQSSTEAVNLKAQPFTPPPSRAGEPLFSEQQTPTRPAG